MLDLLFWGVKEQCRHTLLTVRLPWRLSGKGATRNPGDSGDLGLIPGVKKMPWRRKCQPAPTFLPGESHGQRSLAGYSLVWSQRAGHDWTTDRTCVTNSDLHSYLLFGFREWLLTNLRSWWLHAPSTRRDSGGSMWPSLVHWDNKSAQTLPSSKANLKRTQASQNWKLLT